MSLLVAGIVLLLFIFVFGEIADRFPEDSEGETDSARHSKNHRFNSYGIFTKE